VCGITGYLGESKKPIATYQIITKLFEKTESRGMDAAGFWGTQAGRDGKIIFHKEPIKASLLVKKEIWRKVARLNPNLLLCHARAASQGVGEPSHNFNNHPFVSHNRLIGLVHNGRITDQEYQALKQKYEVLSECDSEILLRVFEGAEKYSRKAKEEFPDFSAHIAARFAGLRDIFSLVNQGHMAVAIGERQDNSRFLWLFRNIHRSLYLVDMRETLGQIFFCSTPEIWQDAIGACESVHAYIGKSHKIIEVPPEEIWFFKITSDAPQVEKVQRFDIARDNDYKQWVYDGERLTINRRNADVEVVCRLDENEDVIKGEKNPNPLPEYNIHEFQTWCQKIKEKVNDIEAQTLIMTQEGSLTLSDFNELMQSLEHNERDMEGILKLLEG